MKQRLVANTRRRIRHSPPHWPLKSNYTLTHICTHARTHTSDPVQKNIYRQCTRGYIHIYIFHLDYLQERKKGSPFWENIKIPTFLFFVKHWFWCRTPASLSLSVSSARRHVTKYKQTNDPDMHVPLEHTHIHTLHGQQPHSYKHGGKLRCSTKFEHMVPVAARKLKRDLSVKHDNGMTGNKKQKKN